MIEEAIREYLREIERRLEAGGQTEMSYRTALQNLLSALLPPGITITEEAQGTSRVGRPDFTLHRAGRPIGYIETKPIGERDLEGREANQEQFDRYKRGLQSIIFTDYLRFLYFRDGELVMETSLATLEGEDQRIHELEPNFGALTELLTAFAGYEGETIDSAPQLAHLMARKAWLMRDAMHESLLEDLTTHRQAKALGQSFTSELLELLDAFRFFLIRDMPPEDFSDVYAQTLTYGLFAARINAPAQTIFSRQTAAEHIPATNPFLRRLFSHIAGPEVDRRILWVIEELIEIFNFYQAEAILSDFDRQEWREDPIIHFYEDFLAVYDSQLRRDRGVWYTPTPVVQYIVGAVDALLVTRFGLEEGLADTSAVTVTETQSDLRTHCRRVVEVPYHKVQILDPATGTGSFLAETVQRIHAKFAQRQGLWQGYVTDHLIPRLNGFELMMASYAIAHLKLEMVLRATGYRIPEHQPPRLRIMLTNTLEEAPAENHPLWMNPLLTREALEANRVKRDAPVMVVVGNPPYRGESYNRGPWIARQMAPYKLEPGGRARLNEQNPKWINDDYVKFLRFGEYMVEKNRSGILAYINPHGYLDNPTFRGMRWHLLQTFDEIYILDLHGNARKRETAPGGERDENVFDIRQGVSINIFVKTGQKKEGTPARVFHRDLYGSRDEKLDWLTHNPFSPGLYHEVKPVAPAHLFVPRGAQGRTEYARGFSIADLMEVNSVGIVSARDHFTVCDSPQQVHRRIDEFLSMNDERARERFNLREDTKDWSVADARADLKAHYPEAGRVIPIAYRPFDTRYIFYTGKTNGLCCRPRPHVMQHLIERDNLALTLSKQVKAFDRYHHALVTNLTVDSTFTSGKTSEITYVFPLYLYRNEGGFFETSTARIPNLNGKIVRRIAKAIGRTFSPEKGEGKGCFTPEDLLDYIYGVLYHPIYRARYFEFLKADFPRIPYPSSRAQFDALVTMGGRLRHLHLMEIPVHGSGITYPMEGTNRVEGLRWAVEGELGLGRVWINASQYFGNVPQSAWDYYIGGYQPAQKWLKDRRGAELSFDEITHYMRIIDTHQETIAIQREMQDSIAVE